MGTRIQPTARRAAPAELLCAVVVAALASAGCGNLSQEDLLFLAAVPQKEEVALVPPGTSRSTSASRVDAAEQALEVACQDADLRCQAQKTASNLNGLTFGLLDLIDGVLALPPTSRALRQRTWGPWFDEDKGATFRFHMVRDRGDLTFSFCLHVAEGNVDPGDADDLTCATDLDTATGFARILSGAFEPGTVRGDRARSGRGELIVEAARVDSGRALGDRVVIRFDNTGGDAPDAPATDIAVDFSGMRIADFADRRFDAHYRFLEDEAGAGAFAFDAYVNLLRRVGDRGPEHLAVTSQWTAAQAGRADANVTDGDAGEIAYTATQCWDASLASVYQVAPDVAEQGDAAACAFATPFSL